jgi:predicted nucleic acid-binding protein
MKARVIDANIVLRFLTRDQPEQAARCKALFARLETGEEVAYIPEVAVSEVVWTLRSFYKWPPQRIRRFVGQVVALKGVWLQERGKLLQALALFAEKNIDFSDALIAAEMLTRGYTEIYSYDRHFDKLAEVERVEP